MAKQRETHDHWFNLAKRQGYRSRAAYKLMQIDDRRKVLHKGDVVLDLGCMPGSWLQVAGQRVGPKGCVWGIDLKDTSPHDLGDNVHVLIGDAAHLEEAGLPVDLRFDAIISDMMPNTTGARDTDHFRSLGVCELAIWLCPRWLKPGGNLVMKVLEGSEMPRLLKDTKALFKKVKPFKPKASRSDSTEIYVVAHGYSGASMEVGEEEPVAGEPPPTPEDW
jgi:23S rRNA (uridine2552-2'-O)-methyltransferase